MNCNWVVTQSPRREVGNSYVTRFSIATVCACFAQGKEEGGARDCLGIVSSVMETGQDRTGQDRQVIQLDEKGLS